MELIDVAKLYKHIKKHYPFSDASTERAREDHEKYLKDFPSDVASQNIDHHILTETVTPLIAHIRGRLGEQLESQRSKKTAETHLLKLDGWAVANDSPPEDFWERGRRLIRGEPIGD